LSEDIQLRDKTIETSVSNLKEDKKTTRNIVVAIQTEMDSIKSIVKENADFLNEAEVKSQYLLELRFLKDIPKNVKSAISNIVKMIDNKLETFETKRQQIKKDLEPLLAKVKLQEELQFKMDAIKEEQIKLNDISLKKKALTNVRTSCKNKAVAIIDKYRLPSVPI